MARFTGKRVLITGGSNGIGLAGATRLASEGAEVWLTGTNPDRLAAAAANIGSARVIANDAADPAAAGELAAAVAEAGGLDGLWLNAGYADVRPLEEVDADFFDRMTAVNVRAPFLQLAAIAPHLREGASVVVTSSTATYEGSPIAAVYAATKGAVVAAARGWAAGLGERGVRVNVLVPGPIDTDFRSFMSADMRQSFEADVTGRTALSRAGTADEAAAVGLFLLSDDASFVTGSQYAVDGGLTMV